MKTKTLLLSLTAAVALGAAAAPAWALETEWVATGTVYGSYDYTGVFGPANTSLDGDSFTADFYIDTSKGTENSEPGIYDEVDGGKAYNILSTPVNATLTINSVTQAFNGTEDDDAYTQTDVYLDQGDVQAQGDVQTYAKNAYSSYLYTEIEGYSGIFPSIIGQAFAVLVGGNGNAGDFGIYDANSDLQVSGELIVNSITSTGVITSAAPEPSAWALLIAGVGMVGATLRLGRRRGWAVA